jgi:hypothetical protein
MDAGIDGQNYVITFSVSPPPVAVGIPDFARGPSNTDALFLPNTIGNGGAFTLSYTNPTTLATGTATVTFSTTATTLRSNLQSALNSLSQISTTNGAPNAAVVVINDSAAAGANVQVTFQNGLSTAISELLTSPTEGVSIAPANINVVNSIPGTGIPIALSNGLGVTSGSFTLQYNPEMLDISGAVSKINGASFSVNTTINNATSATTVISLSSPTAISLTSGPITMGSLLASVPLTATSSYGAKQLLHFSAVQLSGTAGPITVTNQDGIQVAAFFGNVSGSGGPLSLSDVNAITTIASLVPSTTAQTIPGFSAFPNLDPVIVGDVALQNLGFVNSTDASVINQELVLPRNSIPFVPTGLPLVISGPDPTLTVGTVLWSANSQTVAVPVNIDTARPQGSSGMTDAVLALSYDPRIFTVSPADVHLGSIALDGSNWKLQAQVNAQTGLIGVELFSSNPIQDTSGGSLVTIAMHPRSGPLSEPGASAADATSSATLTILPFADPSGGNRIYQTQVSDAQGAFVLTVVPNSPFVERSQSAAELQAPSSLGSIAEPAIPASASAEASLSSALRSPTADQTVEDSPPPSWWVLPPAQTLEQAFTILATERDTPFSSSVSSAEFHPLSQGNRQPNWLSESGFAAVFASEDDSAGPESSHHRLEDD